MEQKQKPLLATAACVCSDSEKSAQKSSFIHSVITVNKQQLWRETTA